MQAIVSALLFLITTTVFAQMARECSELFASSDGTFQFEDPRGRWHSVARSRGGRTLYRIEPRDGSPDIASKEYEFGIADHDLEQLAFLRGIILRGGSNFKIVEARKGKSDKIIEWDFVRGQNLHKVLTGKDPKYEPIRKKVREVYLENIKAMKDQADREGIPCYIEEKFFAKELFADGLHDGLPILILQRRYDGGAEDVIVKTDNIVVHDDSTLNSIKMTIVDPD